MATLEEIKTKKVPRHVAVIMDGNGRCAQRRGNSRIFGHRNGVTAVRDVVEGAGQAGVEYLTLYAFSTENWNRPKLEVDALMELLVKALSDEVENLHRNNVRLTIIGDRQSLPANVIAKLNRGIELTQNNTGLTLVLALSYSSRWEIRKAVADIARDAACGKLDPDTIDDALISSRLETAGMPDPELLIRTSGELRISNFMLYQLAYTELYFTQKLWPDIRKEDLYDAIADFQGRERRFGKTSEQMSQNNPEPGTGVNPAQ